MNLYASVIGEGDPLLLIHGLFGMGDNLAMVARPMSEHFEVHSLDLRNHGRSPRAPSMTFTEMAGDVLDYMNSRQIEKAHVLGHSLGGKVAMQLALMHPERISHLVVADIAPVTYHQRGHDDVFAALKAVDLSSIGSRKEAELSMVPHLEEAGVRQFILKNLYRLDDGRFDWRINVEVLEQCYDQMREGVTPDGCFKGETLFIKGENSPYIQEKHRETILQLFPSAEIEVVAGAGHWLHAEKPDAFNTLVKSFLLEK